MLPSGCGLSIHHPSIYWQIIQQFTHPFIHLSFHPSFYFVIPQPLVSADCIILLITVLQLTQFGFVSALNEICLQTKKKQSIGRMENIKIWFQSLYDTSGSSSSIGYPLAKCVKSIGSLLSDSLRDKGDGSPALSCQSAHPHFPKDLKATKDENRWATVNSYCSKSKAHLLPPAIKQPRQGQI